MSSYSIKLLGSFSVTDQDGSPVHFRSDKVRALLAYLIIEGNTPLHREQLMALLWPHVAERSARDSLRAGLYRLRKALPNRKEDDVICGIIDTQGQYVQLNRNYAYEADVEQFLVALNEAHSIRRSDWQFDDDYLVQLERAVKQYRGSFLTDISIDDSGGFEEWSQGQRVRLRTKMLDALAGLATIHFHRGNYGQAEEYVLRQLKLDNLRESAYQQQMKILAHSGRSAEAKRVYDEMARLLMAELGMRPGSQSTALLEEIRGGGLIANRTSKLQVRGYQLQEKRGEGAFGAVYQAVQSVVGRTVAVKVVKPEYASRADFIRRFEAEAQIVARLEHPHIVPLYDYWREPEGAYLVMRWLEGGNLEEQLGRFNEDTGRLLTITEQIASALAYSHEHGIIHRDLKPANILLDESDNAYLSDFGIAKDTLRAVGLTQVDAVIGSPAYISPEQILNEPVTPQTDIYTFGVVIFELLTGEKPFRGASLATLIYKHVNESLPLIKDLRDGLPDGIDEIIQRATAKSPADRYSTPLEISQALNRLFNGTVRSDLGQNLLEVDNRYIGQNPYRGLHAFREADADLFFGRSALVEQIIGRWRQDSIAETTVKERFLAIVGPSGSGKSSVVKAGVIPALRASALPFSEDWFISEMVPGTHPFEELESALRRVLSDAPDDLLAPLQKDKRGLIRILRHSMPVGTDGRVGQLLLIIDQFEELFTLVKDETKRQAFVDLLLATLNDQRSQLRIIVTLRADFYDRPLAYSELGELLRGQTEIILPLNAIELEEAVRLPAARAGVQLEDGLVSAIIADVTDQPGALPLLQYALTEIFEARQGTVMTLASYHEIGGVLGAIGSRAEELYQSLESKQRAIVQQLFLRLVTLGAGSQDTRRRVMQAEVKSAIASIDLEASGYFDVVIDRFGRHRLLTFDRDQVTRESTVEVAHEALIREWPRLREWLENGREDIRKQRRLATAAAEWVQNDREDSFLLRGANLEQFAEWTEGASIGLTESEQRFLSQSVVVAQKQLKAEESRRQRELDQARQLAENERLRAEEQVKAAHDLSRRARWLTGVAVVAGLAAILAFYFAYLSAENAERAISNAQAAATNEAVAVVNLEGQQTAQADVLVKVDELATRAVELEIESTKSAAAQAEAQDQASAAQAAEMLAQQQRLEAESQARLAQAGALAVSSIGNLEVDPELSMLLALNSLEMQYTSQGELALRNSLQQFRLLHQFQVGPFARPIFDPSGEFLIINESGEETAILRVADGQELYRVPGYFEGPGDLADTYYTSEFDAETHKITFVSRELLSGDEVDRFDIDFLAAGIEDFQVWATPFKSRLVHLLRDESSNILNGISFVNYRTGENTQMVTVHNADINVIWDSTETELIGFSDFENVITIWDMEKGQLLGRFVGHTSRVTGIHFLPDTNRIISSSFDGTVRTWSLESGQQLDQFSVVTFLTRLDVSEDGQKVALSAQDGNVYIYDLATGTELLTLSGHAQMVLWVKFSANGEMLATQSFDGNVRIWDISEAGRGELFNQNSRPFSKALVHNPAGMEFAVGTNDGVIEIRDAHSGTLLKELNGHNGTVRTLFYDPAGNYLFSGSDDETVIIWDAATYSPLLQFMAVATDEDYPGLFPGVNAVAYDPGSDLLLTAGADGTARLWAVGESVERQTGILFHEIIDTLPPILNASFGSDGAMVILAIEDFFSVDSGFSNETRATIHIYDNSYQNPLILEGANDRMWGLAVSADGSLVAAGGIEGTIYIWDAQSGDLIEIVEGHSAEIVGLEFSGNSRQLASIAVDRVAKIWDMDSFSARTILGTQAHGLLGFSFRPDSSSYIISTQDGMLLASTLSIDELVKIANSRLTRTLTPAECEQFLQRPCASDEANVLTPSLISSAAIRFTCMWKSICPVALI